MHTHPHPHVHVHVDVPMCIVVSAHVHVCVYTHICVYGYVYVNTCDVYIYTYIYIYIIWYFYVRKIVYMKTHTAGGHLLQQQKQTQSLWHVPHSELPQVTGQICTSGPISRTSVARCGDVTGAFFSGSSSVLAPNLGLESPIIPPEHSLIFRLMKSQKKRHKIMYFMSL